jgi:hypothetical protein
MMLLIRPPMVITAAGSARAMACWTVTAFRADRMTVIRPRIAPEIAHKVASRRVACQRPGRNINSHPKAAFITCQSPLRTQAAPH